MNQNDPAYPVLSSEEGVSQCWDRGLTKREYIATRIMAGLMARATLSADHDGDCLSLARHAVGYADAMIAELAKKPTRPVTPPCPYCTSPLEIHSNGGTLYGVCLEQGCTESAGAEFAVVLQGGKYSIAP